MPTLEASRRDPVSRRILLPGWSRRSRWGWDPVLECYWAHLVPLRRDAAVLEVSREHLVPTLASLARTLAARAALDDRVVFVALTGGSVPSSRGGAPCGTSPLTPPRDSSGDVAGTGHAPTPGRRSAAPRPSLEGR